MGHFPMPNAFLIAFSFTKGCVVEMLLLSSYQGQRVHSVLNIAQSINALKLTQSVQDKSFWTFFAFREGGIVSDVCVSQSLTVSDSQRAPRP